MATTPEQQNTTAEPAKRGRPAGQKMAGERISARVADGLVERATELRWSLRIEKFDDVISRALDLGLTELEKSAK